MLLSLLRETRAAARLLHRETGGVGRVTDANVITEGLWLYRRELLARLARIGIRWDAVAQEAATEYARRSGKGTPATVARDASDVEPVYVVDE